MKTARQIERETRQAVKEDLLLTGADVILLERREAVKAELKRLDDRLKPRITATIDLNGEGRFVIDGRQVELKRSVRNSVAWKPLCYSLVPESAILDVQPSFTEPYTCDSCKVIS